MAKKLSLPTITVSEGGKVHINEELYDFDWLSKQNVKHWMKNGTACGDRCALYSDDERNRFIHIAMQKDDLVKLLVEKGIFELA